MKNLIEKFKEKPVEVGIGFNKKGYFEVAQGELKQQDAERFVKIAEQHRLKGIIEALESHKITCEMFSDWSAQTLAYGMLKEEIEKYQEQLKKIKE